MMWGMVTKKNKRSKSDKLVPGQQYPLWPNADGILSLPQHSTEPLNVSRLQHSPPLRHVARVSRLHIPRSRSLLLWLLEKSSAAVGFGTAKELHFAMWLSALLESCDFGAVEITLVVRSAGEELALDRETVLRYLVRQTSAGSEFRSDGHIITFR